MMSLFSSCRKDDDITRPVITIMEPQSGSVHWVTDTLHVLATIKHEKEISEVSIVIRDQYGQKVTVPKYFFPDSKDYLLDADYMINAPGLLSNGYSLTIEATDGSIGNKEYQPIYLQGVNREFQRALALCRPSQLKTYIYSIAEDWEAESIKTLNYGFLKAEISPSQRKLKMIRPQPSALLVYDLDELLEDEWLAASPPFPVFNDLYTDGPLTYLATGNGDIKGVNQYAHVEYTTPVMDTVPQLLHTHSNLVMAFSHSRVGSERFIMQYYTGTGSLKAWKKIGFDIISMFSADNEFCVLFTMDGSICNIYPYHVEDNYLGESIALPDGEIRDVIRVGANDYLIAHSDGIFRYSFDTGNLVFWSIEKDVQNMAFDDLRSLLYCSTVYDIKVFRADNAGLVKQITLLFPIYDILIQYNK